MANRSYLYNVDFSRLDRQKTPEDPILSVSEYSYRVPLAYKILLSGNTQMCPSILWDYEHPIAIMGDAEKGKVRLLEFLSQLLQKSLFSSDYLQNEINATRAFFDQNRYDLKYFHLEAGELYQMEDTPFEKQNLITFEEIKNLNNTIQLFYSMVEKLNMDVEELKAKKDKKARTSWFKKEDYTLSEDERSKIVTTMSNSELEKKSLLGIDNWRTILYYQFETDKT